MIKDKLGEEPIFSICLYDLNCSSVTLNELLSVLYLNMADDGLESLVFESFPKECELDQNLLIDIASKAAPTLKTLVLWEQKLQSLAMQSLIKLIEKVLELNAPIEGLNLLEFSEKEYEG